MSYKDEQADWLEERDMDATSIDSAEEETQAGDFSETDVLLADDYDEADAEADAYSPDREVMDFIGDSSIVFDVEDLVAQFEAESEGTSNPSSRLRKRLEAIAERKRRHADLMDFNDYDI